MTPPHHSHIQHDSAPDRPPVVLQCTLDEHMSRVFPNYHWEPTPPEYLRMALYASGATDDTLQEHLALLNQQWDDIFAQAPNGRPVVLGEKPQLNSKDVLYYPIPNSTFAIHIWDGNMEQYGQYCFDFFNVSKHLPVDIPDGYQVWYHQYLGQVTFENELVPWETALKVERVAEGMEKYSVEEGSRLVLTHPNTDHYFFEIPCQHRSTTGFAQPQASIPE